MAHCYVCASRDLAADADPRSPTCEDCKPARDHVVSMQTGDAGTSLAVCQCGWTSELPWHARLTTQAVKIRMHWRAMNRAARAA